MAIPTDKATLLAAIETEFEKLVAEFTVLTPEQVHLKAMEGHAKGTVMSPKDLLGYLIGWGELVLKWNRLNFQDIEIDFPEIGYKWNELDALAQKFYQDYEHNTYEEALLKLLIVKDKIVLLIQQLSDEELYEFPFYKNYPFGRMIQLNTVSPYKNARLRLRRWKKLFNDKKV